MELGMPQLYSEVNRVAREMDLTYLKELGPFLQALSCIASRSEEFKDEGDMVMPGKEISMVYGNMAGSFMLFRGAALLDS